RRWLNRPLRDHALLKSRYHCVATLMQERRYESLQGPLNGIGDVERILARVALKSARPRDIGQLRHTLGALPSLQRMLTPLAIPLLAEIGKELGEHPETYALLKKALAENPPALARDGGVFAEGYDPELDELRRIGQHGDQFLAELEVRERLRSGITTLRVNY